MILVSFHDIKNIIIILTFIGGFGYVLVMKLVKRFNWQYLNFYKYSIPYVGGLIVEGITIIIFTFAYFFYDGYVSGGVLAFLFTVGFDLIGFGDCNLSKFLEDEKSHTEDIKFLKNMMECTIGIGVLCIIECILL
jgi:hypothetical protein